MNTVISLAKEAQLLNTSRNEWKGREKAYDELVEKLEAFRQLCIQDYLNNIQTEEE